MTLPKQMSRVKRPLRAEARACSQAARLARELSERDRQLQASEAARRDLEKKAEDARREAKARAAEASRAAADAEAARKERDAARRERDAAGRERDRAAQEGEELRDKVGLMDRGRSTGCDWRRAHAGVAAQLRQQYRQRAPSHAGPGAAAWPGRRACGCGCRADAGGGDGAQGTGLGEADRCAGDPGAWGHGGHACCGGRVRATAQSGWRASLVTAAATDGRQHLAGRARASRLPGAGARHAKIAFVDGVRRSIGTITRM